VKHSLALALRDAAPVVASVAQGKSLSDALARWRAAPADETGASAVIDLTHGTLRRFGLVHHLVRLLSDREPEDAELKALLWCALYALESGRYAPYTVVHQAVQACGLLEKWNAKRYVNAVLRSYGRRKEELHAGAKDVPEARYQHPHWWIQAVRAAFPERWEQVLETSNGHPPMCLRVNRRRTTVEAYAARLSTEGMVAKRMAEDGVLLERPVPVARLPGFSAGEVSVQDAGAQWAARYLDASDGMRVLDACAAPGGKTAHILERSNAEVVALDADFERLGRVASNLERLGLRAALQAADCTALSAWWDGTPFDRVLADVPCSASGVVRRHPDIKWLRRQDDLRGFALRQGLILDALWRVLRPGGKLLYVTCSVFPQENDEVVEAFVARAGGARRLALPDGSPGQKLPEAQQDGFYYALVEKEA
jgi:16S rRNA (cytosine967-C5)-methyltransferase